MAIEIHNIFDDMPPPAGEEAFLELLRRPGLRIERIVSHGHATAGWFDQPEDEWVIVLRGRATLEFAGPPRMATQDADAQGLDAQRPDLRDLVAGDHCHIPAHQRHRVAWTPPDEPTVWLAVHFDPDGLQAKDL